MNITAFFKAMDYKPANLAKAVNISVYRAKKILTDVDNTKYIEAIAILKLTGASLDELYGIDKSGDSCTSHFDAKEEYKTSKEAYHMLFLGMCISL